MYKYIEYQRQWRKNNPDKVKKYNKTNNDKWHPILDPINNKRRIWFKGKQILLKENPRKGICKWCGLKGYTQIHHIEYHDEDPLKDTIELCASCHRKETIRLQVKAE